MVILGAGPNRIGQGIEFDYCCVHAAMTVRESGRDAVMINCNPETVSTDYDTSDRLYFEPLTLEDVLAVVEQEDPLGVIVQFGGQTPLKLASGLEQAGVPLLGTSVEAIDLAEDRARFGALLDELGYKAPPYATASSVAGGARQRRVGRLPAAGAPLLRARRTGDGDRLLAGGPGRLPAPRGRAERRAHLPRPLPGGLARGGRRRPLRPRARSGSAGSCSTSRRPACTRATAPACCPRTRSAKRCSSRSGPPRATSRWRSAWSGLLNVQFAIHAGELYVIEANPRASRTVPFVSKAVGGAAGEARLPDHARRDASPSFGLPAERQGLGFGSHVSVKEAVLPFDRFEGSDALLGPEMRSTGEVMGIARDFPTAFAKAQAAAGVPLPSGGTAFITVTDEDKTAAAGIAQTLHDNGFRILATRGTAQAIARMGVPVEPLNKLGEGSPHVLDWIERGEVDLVVNTPTGVGARSDGHEIRRAAVAHGIPCLTTLAAGASAARAIARAAARRRARGAVPAGAAPRAARAPSGQPVHRRHRSPAGPAWRELEPARALRRRTPPAGGRRQREARRLPPAARARPRRRLRPRAVRDARRRARAGEAAATSARSCARALSVARHTGEEAHFLLEDVGPGTRRLCELQAGERVLGARARWGAASARPSRAVGRCWSAAASGSPR